MFAIYDSVNRRFATCMEYPMFGDVTHWSSDVTKARLHEKVTTTRRYFNALSRQMSEIIPLVNQGVWDGDSDWDKRMRIWAEEADRRTSAGLKNFGLQIVEVEIIVARINITEVK